MQKLARQRCLPAAVMLVLLCTGCDPSAPVGSHSLAIRGGAAHEGHPAVGRLQAGGEFICGGILVGLQTALTSAHCVSEEPMQLLLDGGEAIAVASAIKHPDFISEEIFADLYSAYYDVAVLRLAAEAPAEGALVNGLPISRGAAITMVGFGATSCDAIDAMVDGEPGLSCQYDLPGKQIGTNTIEQVYGHELSIAGDVNVCKGDSGGAVLGTVDGVEVVVGIPARSKMPCGVRSYATRLDVLVPWLLQASGGDINVYHPAQDSGGVIADGWSGAEAAGDAGDRCTRWGVCGSPAERNLQAGCGCRVSDGPTESLLWVLALAMLYGARRRFFLARGD